MGPADHCMGRGGASSHPPALTGPGGPGRRSGRRRQCLPRLWWPSSWAAGPERSRGASGTTPGRPPRRRSRPAGCSRLQRCYTGRHGVSVGLRPAPSHADLPGLGHSPVCSPLCSGPPGGSALEVDRSAQPACAVRAVGRLQARTGTSSGREITASAPGAPSSMRKVGTWQGTGAPGATGEWARFLDKQLEQILFSSGFLLFSNYGAFPSTQSTLPLRAMGVEGVEPTLVVVPEMPPGTSSLH